MWSQTQMTGLYILCNVPIVTPNLEVVVSKVSLEVSELVFDSTYCMCIYIHTSHLDIHLCYVYCHLRMYICTYTCTPHCGFTSFLFCMHTLDHGCRHTTSLLGAHRVCVPVSCSGDSCRPHLSMFQHTLFYLF